MKFAVLLAAIFLTACTTSPYQYRENPTSLKKGVSKYHVKSVELTLENSKKLWTSNDVVASYPSQDTVKLMVAEEMRRLLKSKGIYAEAQNEANATIDVNLNYRRSFVVGSGVTYPTVSFSLTGRDGQGEEVVSYYSGEGLLKGGGRKSIVNDHKILLGKYDQEEEREDIAAVASLIYEAIANMGN